MGRFVVWSKFLELAGYHIICVNDRDTDPGTVNPEPKSICQSENNAIANNVLPESEILELALKPFNGRTIKNLVRTAQALALSSNAPLRLEHIQTVVKAQEKFLSEFSQATYSRKRKVEEADCGDEGMSRSTGKRRY
jgi:isocitrate dehydrogenase